MQSEDKTESTRRLVLFCSAANFLNAADRVIMPVAMMRLSKEHNYDLHEQAWVLSAFPLGYAASQIVGSCAGAQLGGRRLLLFVALLWSFSTLFTPFVAAQLHLLIFARVMLGLGEGLGLPTIYQIFAESVPVEHRSRAFAYLSAFGGIGQTVAAVCSPHVPWRWPFYLFGSLGFVWCVMWLRMNELDGLPCLPLPQQLLCKQTTNPMRMWRSFFTKKPLLAIYGAHFCMNWTSYIIMHWLPTYLHTTFNANDTDLSLAALPYVLNSLCSIGVGHIADSLINEHRMSLRFVRKLCTGIGLIGPALLLFAFSAMGNIYAAVMLVLGGGGALGIL